VATGLFQNRQRHSLAGDPARAPGLGELILPETRTGLSDHARQVNRANAKRMTMVCCQMFGNQTTVTVAAARGHFELNVYKPVLAYFMMNPSTAVGCSSLVHGTLPWWENAPTKSAFGI